MQKIEFVEILKTWNPSEIFESAGSPISKVEESSCYLETWSLGLGKPSRRAKRILDKALFGCWSIIFITLEAVQLFEEPFVEDAFAHLAIVSRILRGSNCVCLLISKAWLRVLEASRASGQSRLEFQKAMSSLRPKNVK
jgi:hypothetical protein